MGNLIGSKPLIDVRKKTESHYFSVVKQIKKTKSAGNCFEKVSVGIE